MAKRRLDTGELLKKNEVDDRWRNPDLWTVDEHASAYEAARLMAAKNVGCIAVTTGGVKGHKRGRVKGVITERDYMRNVVSGEFNDTSKVSEVGTFGSENIIVATPEDSVRDCVKLMIDKNFRHLPVVDDGEVIGLLSIRDLTRQLIYNHRIELRDLFSVARPRV